MLTYAILQPGNELPLAFIQSARSPTTLELASVVAEDQGFPDIDALLVRYPDLVLGYAIVH
jgi:hypothetical protein